MMLLPQIWLMMIYHAVGTLAMDVWYDPMDVISANWTAELGAYSVITSQNCPEPNVACWVLSSDAIMSRTISTVGHQNIQLTYSVSSTGHDRANEFCIVEYSVNNVDFTDIFNANTNIAPNTTHVPYRSWGAAVDDQSTLTIRIRNSGGGHNCFFGEFRLESGTKYYSQPCGTRNWCYYADIVTTPGEVTSINLAVTQKGQITNLWHRFYIYITPIGSIPCYEPTISFSYERIEYHGGQPLWNVYGPDDVKFSECGASVLRHCTGYESCLSDYDLGIDLIEPNDTMKLIQLATWSVDSVCDELSVNVAVTITCSVPTGHPTADPTKYPTTSAPTLSPTEITPMPTMSPTPNVTDCGERKTCYHVAITPQHQVATSIDLLVKGRDYKNPGEISYFYLYLTAMGQYACIEATFTVMFEPLDFSPEAGSEISVHAADGSQITQCGGPGVPSSCGKYIACLTGYSLGIKVIEPNEEAQVAMIQVPREVDGTCESQYPGVALNAMVTITCSDKTIDPTQYPTLIPTGNPTTEPTTAHPTYNRDPYGCDANGHHVNGVSTTQCWHVNVYPNINELITSTTVNLNVIDDDSETNLYIYFHVNGAACLNPTVSFRYEDLDYGDKAGYLDIRDDNNVRIPDSVCRGCSSVLVHCGSYCYCVRDKSLGISQIDDGTIYKITVFESWQVDKPQYCGYTTRAYLTLYCNQPTDSPTYPPIPSVSPTFNPSSQPTVSPTNNPTRDPSSHPSDSPTNPPTTSEPTSSTSAPTFNPSSQPTVSPTNNPTRDPSSHPSDSPTNHPTTSEPSSATNAPTTSEPTSSTSAPTTAEPSNAPITLEPSSAAINNVPTDSPITAHPATAPTLCPVREFVNNLEFVVFYNDNNPNWYENYFSLLVYSNLMVEAVLTSIQQSTAHSICDFQMCSIFSTDIDKNCSDYRFGDDTPIRWTYIAFGIFRVNKFKDDIIKLMSSDDFMTEFTKNMNDLLDYRIGSNENRRNLLTDNFEASSIIVLDTTQKDEASQNSNNNDDDAIIIVVVVVILILVGIAIGVAIYLKKRKVKSQNEEIGANVKEAVQLTNADTPNTAVNITSATGNDTEGTDDITKSKFAE